MTKTWLFLLLLLAALPLGAQYISFNKIVVPTGNFSGFVSGIAQDKNGYMWIATNKGLYKYDGYRFKLYTNDPADPNSLVNDRLVSIYIDPSGIIWLITWIYGLDRLDPTTGTLTHFRHNPHDRNSLGSDTVRSVLLDRDGILWVGTSNGLDRYDAKTNRFHHYTHNPQDPRSLSCNRVRKIYEDKQGILWVGTGSAWNSEGGKTKEGGLNRLDKKTGTFNRYMHNDQDPYTLINNKVESIFEDSRGIFWIGTAGDGLHTMDRNSGRIQRHHYYPAQPEKLSRSPLKSTIFPDYITAIAEDVLGNIWIGTLANGINRYDPKTQKVVHYSNEDTALGFTDNSASSFYSSRDGIFWIGIFQGGLYRVDPYHKTIPYVRLGTYVHAFQQDRTGKLWIGTNEGLLVYNKANGTLLKKFVHDPLDTTSLSSNTVTALFRDWSGVLWVGTANGLNRFHEQSQSFTQYKYNPNDPGSISKGRILIAEGGGDSLWVGTTQCLYLLNKRNGRFTHFRNDPRDNTSMSRNNTSALLRDKEGNLWVGAWPGGGLNYMERSSRRFRHFMKGITVLCLLQDASGTLWVGTQEAGLYKKNKNSTVFTKFTNPGVEMKNTIIHTLEKDNEQNVWASTSEGIYRIHPQSGQATNFGAGYGINAAKLAYTSAYKGSEGEIYIGDMSGYYFFSPGKFIFNPTTPQVVLTDLRIRGRSVMLNKKTPFKGPLEQAEKIELSYDQNMLAFDFAAIHYSSPENNRHLYQLGNYDAEWREVGMEKSAYYFNVPPGNYVFRIKAASSEGKWAEKAIAVVIHPPWWRTWWAYSVYGICFLAGVFFLNHIQRQQLIQRERERTREKELAQAKEIEKAYHELRRTQAQLIQQELLKSQIEIQEQTLKSVSEEIHDNVGQVLSLLKLNISMMNPYESKDLDEKITDSKQLVSKAILDLRRLSKSLNTDYISEVGLIPSIELELEQIKKVGKYKTELQISGQVLHLDKHKELILFRIFQEALNNIIKHAQATSIMVCLIYKENTLVMEIIDDGQGFDLAKSIEDCNGIKTGIGIKSIQNRANLIGANFDIQSSTGKGTRININLPI